MKKLICFILVISSLLCLTACGTKYKDLSIENPFPRNRDGNKYVQSIKEIKPEEFEMLQRCAKETVQSYNFDSKYEVDYNSFELLEYNLDYSYYEDTTEHEVPLKNKPITKSSDMLLIRNCINICTFKFKYTCTNTTTNEKETKFINSEIINFIVDKKGNLSIVLSKTSYTQMFANPNSLTIFVNSDRISKDNFGTRRFPQRKYFAPRNAPPRAKTAPLPRGMRPTQTYRAGGVSTTFSRR